MSISSAYKRARVLTVTVAALATAALVAGCGGSATPAPAAQDTASAAAEGAFPATINHVYGQTTIEAEPERVVTLGWGSQDAVAALGVVPVGVTDFTWGTVDTYLPWFTDKVEELGGQMPEVVRGLDSGEYDYEQVLALEPDVIIARHSGITETEYQRLSEIAPTIAYRDLAWASDWQDVQLTVGTVLGRQEAAQKIVDETNEVIAGYAADHPEFAGTTFAYGAPWSEGESVLGLYSVNDARVKLIEQLGLTSAPSVVDRSRNSEDFAFDVSLEEVDSIDADLFIAWAQDDAQWASMQANPLLASWAPIASGESYAMTEQGLAWSSSAPSALAIPWSFDIIVPELAKAVANG